MPIFTIAQAIMSRIIVGIAVVLTALGLSTVSDTISQPVEQENELGESNELVLDTEEIVPQVQEIPNKITSTGNEVDPIELEPEKDSIQNIEPPTEESVTPSENQKLPEDIENVNTENLATSTEETNQIDFVDYSTINTLPVVPFSQINTDTSEALVNILCTQNALGAVNPITGSGVIIDPRGVIITNAHVAQFFLLKDYPVEDALQCVIRTGSPARHTYTAELLYISPEWLNLHIPDITKQEPKGTGEHDYAFLRITGRTDPNIEIPEELPFIPIDTDNMNIKTGDKVLAAAYPAGFLGGVSIQRDLYSVSSLATVGERFTFVANTIDLFSIGGTVVSQGGSSGGAIVSDKNRLIGIIVTSTQADTTAERDLRAITLGYINKSLFENANTTIERLLFGDITLKAGLFNTVSAPIFTNMFLQYLTN